MAHAKGAPPVSADYFLLVFPVESMSDKTLTQKTRLKTKNENHFYHLDWAARKTDHNRLGFAVLFKFFQYKARFPTTRSEIPQSVIDYVARQLIVPPEFFNRHLQNINSVV